jgi:hypothetical protein
VDAEGSDYELHHRFVHLCSSPGPVARVVQKALERKHDGAVAAMAESRDAAALERLWREAVAAGEPAGAYWALLTHPLADAVLRARVQGEVHMLSHLAGASRAAEARQITRLRQRREELGAELEKVRAAGARRAEADRARIEELQRQLQEAGEARVRLARMEERLRDFDPDGETDSLRRRVRDLESELAAAREETEQVRRTAQDWVRLAGDLQVQVSRLEAELAEVNREGEALEHALAAAVSGHSSPGGGQSCAGPDLDLCGRCVLYVGGRTNLAPHFRALVERNNGQFLHHDGGQECGTARLEATLARADVVLCPVDCVSHDAYHRARHFCRHRGTPLVLLRSSGLSAFTRALREASSAPVAIAAAGVSP